MDPFIIPGGPGLTFAERKELLTRQLEFEAQVRQRAREANIELERMRLAGYCNKYGSDSKRPDNLGDMVRRVVPVNDLAEGRVWENVPPPPVVTLGPTVSAGLDSSKEFPEVSAACAVPRAIGGTEPEGGDKGDREGVY